MENSVEKRFIFPANWKMTKGFEVILLVLILGVFGTATYFGYPYANKALSGNSADLVGGVNKFAGFAPGIELNGGMKPNKESRMFKEFGLKLELQHYEDMGTLSNGLLNGNLDFIFTTTDISPISMDETSELAKMSVAQFLKIDDSRGADVFIVDESIKTIADLKGKKVACALGWPSNTLLAKTLEAGGLTEKDITILRMGDPGAAKNSYLTGEADACVVWSPDDIQCLKDRASRVLTSTQYMPNIIMDGFIARKEVLEKKHDEFVKLSEAWLTANSEMTVEANLEKAARAFKLAFSVEDNVSDIVDGMKLIHFATYGDNLNFFGLSTDFTGITGQMLYNGMARIYKNGYGNNFGNITPWAEASYPNIIQDIKKLSNSGNQVGEGQVKFTPVTSEIASAPAIATKRLTVNFETNSYILTPNEKQRINREIGQSSLDFSGFRMRVEGNTDDTGNRSANIILSKKRADAVVNYLISEYKFDSNRFIILGNGPDKPVASNDTEEGKASNRRTDFEFIQK